MNIFHNLMAKLGRYRLILDRQSREPYMHRYYPLFKDRVKFPFNILLHKIVRSDDPVYHDHPWSYTTIVLKGGYWEHTPVFHYGRVVSDQVTWRGPGSIITRGAHEFHWLELDDDQPATTLFIPKKRTREWGFLVNDTWIPHTEYLVK
jgi:hypothetical protein